MRDDDNAQPLRCAAGMKRAAVAPGLSSHDATAARMRQSILTLAALATLPQLSIWDLTKAVMSAPAGPVTAP